MKIELTALVSKLKKENQNRSDKMNSDVSDYAHTALVHTYNNTLGIIKQLEYILK